jgi:hypothetical protein
MEHRMTALETRLDTILPTLATKADVATLGTRLDAIVLTLATKDILATRADIAALQARFDTILPTLATKADVQETNAIITTWGLATMITIVGMILVAIFGFSQIYKNVVPVVPAAQPAPISVTVPGAFAPSEPSNQAIIASAPAGAMRQSA